MALLERLLEETKSLGRIPLVVDPFAGVGGIHDFWPVAIGVELEREWAEQAEKALYDPASMIQGDALRLPFASGSVPVVCTSPCYGNRLADHHNAKEKCRPCDGTGTIPQTGRGGDGFYKCEKCDGAGRREYDRITYRHKLGRMPTAGSSAVMQWGDDYRRFHEAAWREVYRVMEPGGLFLLNVGDHIRNRERVQISRWHYRAVKLTGFEFEQRIRVPVQKMRKGANRNARVPYEHVVSFRKVQA